MTFKGVLFASVALGAIGARGASAQAAPEAAELRKAAERSLPFLETGGAAWIQEKGCASCHHVPFLLWSHNEARRRGLAVDAGKLEGWTNWTLTASLALGKEGGGLDTMGQLILGRDGASRWRQKPPKHLKTVDPFETLWEHIVERQNPDGSWKPEGQLTCPPEITTGWALLALASRETKPPPEDPAKGPSVGIGPGLVKQLKKIEETLPKAREQGIAYLRQAPSDQSTESLLLRMLVERKLGDAGRAGELRKELLALQRPDGLWSYRKTAEAGDAFATGQVLYALSVDGVEADDPALRKACKALIETQRPDGSWTVAARSIRTGKDGDPKKIDFVYTYWGSAWATIGLLQSLPLKP